MAILFFDTSMDAGLRQNILATLTPLRQWVVNETITAYEVPLINFEKNEFVLARLFPTLSKENRIQYKKQNGHFIENKN